MPDYSNLTMKAMASQLAGELGQRGISVVVVGGLAVDIYTDNRYLTKDIDMVDISGKSNRALQEAMHDLGFSKEGRHYAHPTSGFIVEFPAGPLGVGDEVVSDTTIIHGDFGEIPVLHAADVIKDRLAWFFDKTSDAQSLVQALCILLLKGYELEQFRSYIEKESSIEQYEYILSIYKELKEEEVDDPMEAIERVVVARKLQDL